MNTERISLFQLWFYTKQYNIIHFLFSKIIFSKFLSTYLFISLPPLKKKAIHIHRGQVLKQAVEATGLNKEVVAEKANYTRASYYKHIQEPDLPYHILIAYGRAINYDFTEELPEMPKYLLEEPPANYDKLVPAAEVAKQVNYWKDKYLDLMEKYNRLIEERMGKK